MCLIRSTVVIGNLPKSVLGYKGYERLNSDNLFAPCFGCYVLFNKTMTAKTLWNKPDSFKVKHGYQCGFHIATSFKSARSWTNSDKNVKYVVGWGLTAWGYLNRDRRNRFTEKTYVTKYMRVFHTMEEAKEFKKKLDARLKKEGK